MRILRNLVRAYLLLGACGLHWWFMHGWWQTSGDTMIDRDWVRFGPIPLTLASLWGLLLVSSPMLGVFRKHAKSTSHIRDDPVA